MALSYENRQNKKEEMSQKCKLMYLSPDRKNMTIFDTKYNIAYVVCMTFIFLAFKALRK
jgi:hypothetical protein